MSDALIGAEALQARLLAIARNLPQEIARALFSEGQIEMGEAKKRTPVEFGALRASGTVNEPEISGRDVSVTLSFGGPAAPYAAFVEFDLEAFHPVGQALFLTSTILESRPYMAERIARRIDLNRAAS